MPPKKISWRGQWKGIKNKRQGEIYQWAKKELYQEKVLPTVNWVTHEPTRQEKEAYVQSHYQGWKINREQRNYLLKETARLYREEIAAKRGQILWYQENAGFTQPSPKRIKKHQSLKLIFPEKGEHQEFQQRKKNLYQIWQAKVQAKKGSLTNRQEVEQVTQELYHASPRRLRDRFLALTENRGRSYGIKEVWDKYYTNNSFTPTKKHYRQAINNVLKQTTTEGEKVPASEIKVDKYGRPQLQSGQVLRLDGTPGRGWSIYQKVPSLEQQIKKKVHDQAHQGYVNEYGTALEKQTWRLKKDKALCWVEATLGQSCEENQGTSSWFCLFCITYGEEHPPVLPIHCSWKYTYKTWLCGAKQHSDANKQWHFSVEGEKVRDAIKGGDWGSCHVGIWQKPRKQMRRK
ncbi:MAG: hypothetical protein MRECE_13c040 [Mycoplasmataceae bacterium CE_OT135]|nr:MAG: hypothetical protein MRECE_13c040 [Mycoplasmataceae bacterium CE_OT135]